MVVNTGGAMNNTTKLKSNIITYNADIFEMTKSRVVSQFNGSSVIIPHVCNNINLFGAGFAAAVSKEYPIVKENFHLLGNKTKLGYVQYIVVAKHKISGNEIIFANMIAQNKTINNVNQRPIHYEALVKCMIDVRNYMINFTKTTELPIEIHCPKFGSGLAGGNWNFITDLIEDIWANQKVFVYNYSNNPQIRK